MLAATDLDTVPPNDKRKAKTMSASLHVPEPIAATRLDPRWAKIAARDRSADGEFFYSVATTGVYCRPSCPSRGARPENVRFHASIAECEAAGFRACKRCKPNEASLDARNAELIAKACRTIEAAEEAPSLADLAAGARLSRITSIGCSRRRPD